MELFAPGCLGTCWYGKYHYMEPYIGCGFNCLYCYARFREQVSAEVQARASRFDRPVTVLPLAKLLSEIKKTADSGAVETVKLSRFTDIFSPPFDKDGTAVEILRVLAQSKVKRIIITTKGLPSREAVELMAQYPAKFSYNAAAKPRGEYRLEQCPENVRERLEAAAEVQKSGVLTTIHMDPLLVGVEDTEELLAPFFDGLAALGLKRVMFSYLLVNSQIAELINKTLTPAQAKTLLERYDGELAKVLPRQDDTAYLNLKPELKAESVKRVARLLTERGFDFVLCSLKSGKESDAKHAGCPLCDGKFYA